MTTEYRQLVSIARRQGRSFSEIGAAWRSANQRLYRNPVDPARRAVLERERRTGAYLSAGVPFTQALAAAGVPLEARRRRNPGVVWYPYKDSEAPGARREDIGREPPYDRENLARGLDWAARVRWGAMRLELPKGSGRGSADAERVLEDFRDRARRLGYELTHVRYGQGDRTWRFRVERRGGGSSSGRQLGLFSNPAWAHVTDGGFGGPYRVWLSHYLKRHGIQNTLPYRGAGLKVDADRAAEARALVRRFKAGIQAGWEPWDSDEPPGARNPSIDWRPWAIGAAVAWLVWRARGASSSTTPPAPTSPGPVTAPPYGSGQAPQLITYTAWWVKYRNNGQQPPMGMDFPAVMVPDLPDRGAGVRIPVV